GAGEAARRLEIPSATEQIVQFDADAQLPQWTPGFAISGKQEGKRLCEMRRDMAQNFFLHTGFPNESDPALLEVAQPAVQQPARAAARAGREIMAIDETDAKPAHGGVARHAAAHDATADH